MPRYRLIAVSTLLGAALAAPMALAQNNGTRTQNCIVDRIIGGGDTNQTVVLENFCTRDVDFAICLNRSDVEWNGFKRGQVRANRKVHLYISDLAPGAKYNYEYYWCYGSTCDADVPDC